MPKTYTDPNANVTRELAVSNLAGVASASMAKFLMFQKCQLKKVHILVGTAGTNTGAQVDVYVGTASVGAVVVGTNTAGSVLHSGAINAAVPANGLIELKGAANTATFVGSVTVETQVDHDADQS